MNKIKSHKPSNRTMPEEERAHNLKTLSTVLKAASHPVRLETISLLSGLEVSVGGLQDQLELPYPVISHHLAYLRRARIVTRRRQGTVMLYWLHDTRLLPLIEAAQTPEQQTPQAV